MIDDRNESPSSHEILDVEIWNRGGMSRLGNGTWEENQLIIMQHPHEPRTFLAYHPLLLMLVNSISFGMRTSSLRLD
jgi:hypothetical protein